jgi:hypothetical protein
MANVKNLHGTSSQTFQIQKGGAKIRNNSGVVEIKDAAATAFANINAADVIAGDASTVGNLKAYGDANYMQHKYATGQSANSTYTWPKPDNGKYLQTDGSGNLSFVSLPTDRTDGQYIASKAFTHESSATINHKELPVGAIVTKVQIVIDEAFDTAATIQVGKTAALTKYVDTTDCDLQGVAKSVYEVVIGNPAVSGSAEQVLITFVNASSTAGEARVLLYYVSPEII